MILLKVIVVKGISGEIGFSKKVESKNNYIYPQKTNFLQQLFENKLISKKNFGIKYDSEYEGRLILGADLKEKNKVDSSPYSFYHYTCDKESQFSDFPDLHLGNFTFNKNDLFKEVGSKYFFLIVFQATQVEVNYWRLGQLFFKKYPIFLNEDADGKNGQISYFSSNKEYEEGGSNLGLIIALSIIIPLIIIAIVVYLIYRYRRQKDSDSIERIDKITN